MTGSSDDLGAAPRPSLVATVHEGSTTAIRSSDERGATLSGHAEAGEGASSPGRPARRLVSRYELRARLGSGGMGVVYEGHDSTLDRAVAVKVLHAEMPKVARLRMQREALALAKLSHPNVVQVFEVGEDAGHTFIAMELVRGQTLDVWARHEPPRSWREVVSAYAQAGAGLAAAHDAGLVHRDFKPSNCIMGDDGRVRVVDFGLAKAVSIDDEVWGDDSVVQPSTRLEPELTAWGAMLGTPAYMAPEQLAGRSGRPASDQFSLCTSLWEALYGQRPFRGETLGGLSARLLSGTIPEPPPGARVPRWLHEVVKRGLMADPERRWPSMRALLEALAQGRARARRRRIAWVLGLLGGMVAAIGGWHRWDQARRTAACEAEGASIEAVWNDEAAAALRAALVRTGVPQAARTAAAVGPWLDAQAGAWAETTTEACLDARVRGTWDAELLERAQWCLDERRMELEALVTELLQARPETVDRAVKAAAGLARVEPCRDALVLSRLPTPPADQRDAVVEVRAMLSSASARLRLGAYDEGLAQARAALAQAEALQWPPLVAEARVRVGWLLERRGDYADAEPMLEDAFFTAVQADAIEAATAAAAGLVYVVGTSLQRPHDGIRWSRHEESIAAALPDPGDVRAIRRFIERANLQHTMGAYDEAKALYDQALALAEPSLGPDHPDVATILHNLAGSEERLGHFAEAESLAERAIQTRRAVLGAEHPDVAASLNHLGRIQATRGALAEAVMSFEQAIHLSERALGPHHPRHATFVGNLAHAYLDLGQPEEARVLHEEARFILEAALGAEHPDVAAALVGIANAQVELGEHDEAVALYERALAIYEPTKGREHPAVAGVLDGLAVAYRRLGDLERARELYEEALAIAEAALGPAHPSLGHSLLGLSQIARAQGRTTEAVALAERVLRLCETNERDPRELAAAQTELAEALWDSRQDRPRAVALVEQARGTLAEVGDQEQVAALDAWLALRG